MVYQHKNTLTIIIMISGCLTIVIITITIIIIIIIIITTIINILVPISTLNGDVSFFPHDWILGEDINQVMQRYYKMRSSMERLQFEKATIEKKEEEEEEEEEKVLYEVQENMFFIIIYNYININRFSVKYIYY